MNVIPHPEFLKKREKDLIAAESDLSMRMCEMYIVEAKLNSQINKQKKRDRNYFMTLLTIFLSGFLLGFTFSLV